MICTGISRHTTCVDWTLTKTAHCTPLLTSMNMQFLPTEVTLSLCHVTPELTNKTLFLIGPWNVPLCLRVGGVIVWRGSRINNGLDKTNVHPMLQLHVVIIHVIGYVAKLQHGFRSCNASADWSPLRSADIAQIL